MQIKIVNKDKFSEHEYKFIQLLELDEEFEGEIKRLRDKWEIPTDGVERGTSIKWWKDTSPSSKYRYQTSIEDDAFTLTTLYNKPKYWVTTFLSILLYNQATPPDRNSSQFQPIQIRKGNNVTITIRENISLRNLKKFIGDNSKQLIDYLSSLPKNPRIKIKNVEIKKTIVQLKRKKNSDKEIGGILDKKFGENELPFSTDYATVGRKRMRFQKALNKKLKKDFDKAKKQEQLDSLSNKEKPQFALQTKHR